MNQFIRNAISSRQYNTYYQPKLGIWWLLAGTLVLVKNSVLLMPVKTFKAHSLNPKNLHIVIETNS